MKILFRIAVCFLGLVLAKSLPAQYLWPDTRAGMTVEEVKKLFPEAHAPDEAGELPGARGTELLTLDEVEIADHRFRVRFFFNKERLVHVDLFESGEFEMKEFEKLRDMLRKKYGLEYSTTSSQSIRLEWHVLTTIIRLQWTPVARGIATISISYDSPIPKEVYRL